MSIIEKKIDLTVKDLKISLSSPLGFYVNDKVRLAFTIKEYDFEITSGTSRRRVLRTVQPVEGTLSIETPEGVDHLENVSIEGDIIYFDLDSKFTGGVGTYQAQLFLKSSEGYRKALPPFSFSVSNTINEGLDQGNIIQGGGGSSVDISGLATKEELNLKADKDHTHQAGEVVFADGETIQEKFNNGGLGGGGSSIDISGLATKEELKTLEDILNDHLENHPSGGGSNSWQEIWVEDIVLDTPVRSISKDVDKSLKQFSEVMILASFSANNDPSVTTNTTFNSISFGGMQFLYYNVAVVSSTMSKNVFATLHINPYMSYSEKIENMNALQYNNNNLSRMLSSGGTITNNKITINSTNDYIGNISLKIYGR